MVVSVFPVFSSLPIELRIQIWREALPDKVGKALYFYRKGCWCLRLPTEADEDYDPEHNHLNLNYKFCHDLLDHVQLEVRKQDLKIRFHMDRYTLLFIRPFDPIHDTIHDTLYVPLNKWDGFLRGPLDRLFEPDLVERNVNCLAPAFKRIAVPKALLQDELDSLSEIFDWYSSIEILFIIVNTQPDLQCEDNKIMVQQRWELESVQGDTFFLSYNLS